MNKKLLNLLVSVLSFIMILTACGDSSFQNETTLKTTTIKENVLDSTDETTVTTNDDASSEQDSMTENEEQISSEQETTTKTEEETSSVQVSTDIKITLADIPAYSGSAYVAINNNVPYFIDAELSKSSCEYYSELDSLGRCGVTYACIGKDIMPTEERGAIGQLKPTGWHTVKYNCVDGNYLYNRCHLIGYQLTGENANTKNLITGTRSMNVDGMLPFEDMVADYVRETGNHVMYRVTPLFDGNNLLANGVLMEAKSVEDNGEGILFNVFVYNVQEGVVIDYITGNSTLKEVPTTEPPTTITEQQTIIQEPPTTVSQFSYPVIGNKNSKAYHRESCSRLPKEKNRVYFDSEGEANAAGYDNPCDYCEP